MRNIKLTLEYDGTGYFGFQKQPSKVTIQSSLEKALSKLFNQKMKIAAASGRTDRGVHALGQVVNFQTESKLKTSQILKGLNSYLPKDIVVKRVVNEKKNFHARYSAKRKTYEYSVWNHPVRSALYLNRVCHFPYELDFTKVKRALKILEGKHDFKSFANRDPSREAKLEKGKGTVRRIEEFKLIKKGSLLRFQVSADGFLYNMVRILVGTVLEFGMGRISERELRGLLRAPNRAKAGRTMPSEGLTLISVSY